MKSNNYSKTIIDKRNNNKH